MNEYTKPMGTEIPDDDKIFAKRNVKNYIGDFIGGVGTQTTYLSSYFLFFHRIS